MSNRMLSPDEFREHYLANSAPAPKIKIGDTFTIAGIHALYRNPARRWWQLWKPRWLTSNELQSFKVTDSK